MKHTPEPWYWNSYSGIFSQDKLLAEVFDIDRERPHGDELITDEAKANARLIAAAPELLEACKILVAWDDEGHLNDVQEAEVLSKACSAARAAIAKAEPPDSKN